MRLFTVIPILALTACTQAGPIRGSADSGTPNLSVGMTLNQVEATVGSATFRTAKGGVTCTSHIYDEVIGAKFIHVEFLNGALIKASDRHRTACEL